MNNKKINQIKKVSKKKKLYCVVFTCDGINLVEVTYDYALHNIGYYCYLESDLTEKDKKLLMSNMQRVEVSSIYSLLVKNAL